MVLLTRQARMGLSISSLHPRMVVTSRHEIARNTTGSTPTPNGTSTSPSMVLSSSTAGRGLPVGRRQFWSKHSRQRNAAISYMSPLQYFSCYSIFMLSPNFIFELCSPWTIVYHKIVEIVGSSQMEKHRRLYLILRQKVSSWNDIFLGPLLNNSANVYI